MWRADSLEKTQMLGKIEGRRQSVVTEDEMVGWHHRLNGHESEQTLGDSEGQGSLVCCSPWGCIESDTNYWLNNNNSPESYLRNTQFQSAVALQVGEGKYSTWGHTSHPLPPKGTEKHRNTCEVHSPELTKTLGSNHRTLKHFSLPLPPPYY